MAEQAPEFSARLAGMVSDYTVALNGKISKIVRKSALEFRDITRATAPIGAGSPWGGVHYHTFIDLKQDTADFYVTKYIWYVKKPKYRLTHLLEYGHEVRNGQKYVHGTVAGRHFVRDAYDRVFPAMTAEIEKAVQESK